MSRQILQYLLVPDSSAARRLRRILAERSACSGIVVGTWSELMEWACRAYGYDSHFLRWADIQALWTEGVPGFETKRREGRLGIR